MQNERWTLQNLSDSGIAVGSDLASKSLSIAKNEAPNHVAEKVFT